MCALLLLAPLLQPLTPPPASGGLGVTGRVIRDLAVQQITLEVIAEANLVPSAPGQTRIEVDPTRVPITYDLEQPGSGYVVAKGEPSTTFVLSFPRSVDLTHVVDGSILQVSYLIAHSAINQPMSADLVREVTQEFRLNDIGEYHFWFGGSVDVSNATGGQYDGDFFMEVSYRF